jgi:peptide methionine sulfoxide reductase msrA/msrB
MQGTGHHHHCFLTHLGIMLLVSFLFLTGCAGLNTPLTSFAKEGREPMPETIKLIEKQTDSKKHTIYLAGGCFWGMEKLMRSLPGVLEVTSGYANGNKVNPTYEEVCSGTTNFKETVKVDYDPTKVSLDTVLYAYYSVIDPTVANKQGNDVGSQYQTGVYYTDLESKTIVEKVATVQKKRYPNFKVENKPLENFYPAEAYHQHYLDKHPQGYCHIPPYAFRRVAEMKVDAGKYQRPNDQEIKKRLSPQQYMVTQQGGTEAPYNNKYDKTFEPGIYVDVVTGEPLFLSTDKFDSGCGWPAFSKPIDPNVVVYRKDTSLATERTEVSSRTGGSHLGHVFVGEGISPTDVRFCIDSASLKFIPYAEMDKAGYGAYKEMVEKEVQKSTTVKP